MNDGARFVKLLSQIGERLCQNAHFANRPTSLKSIFLQHGLTLNSPQAGLLRTRTRLHETYLAFCGVGLPSQSCLRQLQQHLDERN